MWADDNSALTATGWINRVNALSNASKTSASSGVGVTSRMTMPLSIAWYRVEVSPPCQAKELAVELYEALRVRLRLLVTGCAERSESARKAQVEAFRALKRHGGHEDARAGALRVGGGLAAQVE